MADSSDYHDDYDYEKQLLSLVADFTKKVKEKAEKIFYDLDDWLDIIDFFIAEEPGNPLLKTALNKAQEFYPGQIQVIIRQAYYTSLINPQIAYAELCENTECMFSNPSNDLSDAALVNYQKGKILIRMGQWQDAFNHLQKALETTQNPFIYEQFAELFLRQKDFKRAAAYITRAIAESKKHIEDDDLILYGAGDFFYLDTVLSDNLLTIAAKLHATQSVYGKPICQLLEDLVKERPFSCDYWEALAEFYLRAGEYEKADEAYDYCLCIKPSDMTIYQRKLQACMNTLDKGRLCRLLEQILPKLQEVLAETADIEEKTLIIDFWKSALREYIEVTSALKWHKKCMSMCNRVLETNKHFSLCDGESFFSVGEIFVFLSRAYNGLGDYEKAMQYSMQAVQREPEYYGHRIQFAELVYDCGDVAKAEEIFYSLYEQCCEKSAVAQSADRTTKERAVYYKKHKYYIIASWAVKMAESGQIQDALDLIKKNTPPKEACLDNEIFIVKCAKLHVLTFSTELRAKAIELLEEMIYADDYSIEAIMHQVPTIAQEIELMNEIKKIKKQIDKNEDF